MKVFTVFLKNQPGQLADVSARIAAKGVNIMLCAVTAGANGFVALVADDEGEARRALDLSGVEFSERPALRVRMEDRSGQAALLAGRLSDADVNIELLLPVRVCDGQAELAVCVSDETAARIALGELVMP